jgi:hypothetical protein
LELFQKKLGLAAGQEHQQGIANFLGALAGLLAATKNDASMWLARRSRTSHIRRVKKVRT